MRSIEKKRGDCGKLNVENTFKVILWPNVPRLNIGSHRMSSFTTHKPLVAEGKQTTFFLPYLPLNWSIIPQIATTT